MSRIVISLILLVCLIPTYSQAQDIKLETKKDKTSYAMGIKIGKSLTNEYMDIDAEIFARGIKDAMLKREPLMSGMDVVVYLNALQVETKKKMEEIAAENEKAGKAFLKENAKKAGVVSLPSGLQYKVIKKGEGVSPKVTDKVVINFKGTTIDGKEFDSTYKNNKPANIVVNRVMPAMTEALQKMKKGAKWELYVPAKLGYGKKGNRKVPPNSTVIMEVELLDIITPPKK